MKVKCPKCKNKNAIELSTKFSENGIETELSKCSKCGIKLSFKAYDTMIRNSSTFKTNHPMSKNSAHKKNLKL